MLQGSEKCTKTSEMVYHNLKKGSVVDRLHFSTSYVNRCNHFYYISWFPTAENPIFRQIVYIK